MENEEWEVNTEDGEDLTREQELDELWEWLKKKLKEKLGDAAGAAARSLIWSILGNQPGGGSLSGEEVPSEDEVGEYDEEMDFVEENDDFWLEEEEDDEEMESCFDEEDPAWE